MTHPLRLALVALATVVLTGCAAALSEAANWRGNVTYDPATGQWGVTVSRPMPADKGLAK